MKTLFSIFIIFITFETLPAQVTQEWAANYNGKANSIAVDGSGNSYVTGQSPGTGTGDDFATVKYNSAGALLWDARYNGSGTGSNRGYAIAVDGSGNVYVTGSGNDAATDDDYITIKFNSAGIQQWVAAYNGPPGTSEDLAVSIAIDSSGNVYVTGGSPGSGTRYDYATVKYNSAGVQQWAARYNGPGNFDDIAYSIALDGSGNVYVTGFSRGSGTLEDYTTIKYNAEGAEQWVVRYNGTDNSIDQAFSITVDSALNVYVTGASFGGLVTGYDYATIKYNSGGLEQWVARYNGPGNSNDGASSISSDNSGNVYVTGTSFEGSGSGDYATIKYNSVGDSVWVERYNGPGNNDDEAKSIVVDGSGNAYVTGFSNGSTTGADYATVKYNSAGVQQWVARYNRPGNSRDEASSIALDASGNVYVTGYSEDTNFISVYTTIKYSQSTGIIQISSIIPEQFSLEQNYPNPFNPKTIINYQCSMFGYVSLKVYDILGKEVATLVNESLSPGTYKVEFDGSNLTSGVYFYRIETGLFTDTKRMLLIK